MRVLSVGEDPSTVDYSKTPEKVDERYIRSSLDKANAEMKSQGWDIEMCFVGPSVGDAVVTLRRRLQAGKFDVVLMGGGLKNPPERTELFEALMNEVRVTSPASRLAFDNDPNEGPKSVARQAGG